MKEGGSTSGRKGKRLHPDVAQEEEENEHVAFQEQTERLLACPCLNDLKNGACGDTFQEAFKCFLLSKQAEKGAECSKEFLSLETCIVAHGEMFDTAKAKNIPKEIPNIPPVPTHGLTFNEKIARWSQQTGEK